IRSGAILLADSDGFRGRIIAIPADVPEYDLNVSIQAVRIGKPDGLVMKRNDGSHHAMSVPGPVHPARPVAGYPASKSAALFGRTLIESLVIGGSVVCRKWLVPIELVVGSAPR